MATKIHYPAERQKEKDPYKQYLGKINKIRGEKFEERLERTFGYYKDRGFAEIEKTPEPMRVVKSLGNGKFIAYFEKKAQPDYKGTLKGGRTIMYEAKYTGEDRINQSRVSREQAEYLDRHQRLGARCYVLAGFSSGEVYCIPWEVWSHMKEHFGRKYAKEPELENYRVQLAWNDTLLLLG